VDKDLLLATLFTHLELDLATKGRHHGRQITDARDRMVLTGDRSPSKCCGGQRFCGGNRESGGDSGAGVYGRGLTYESGEAGNHLKEMLGYQRPDLSLLTDE
jgi:uncharacterized protein (DUF169 family)